MSVAHVCEMCNGVARWSLVRIGDVAHTWACSTHLDLVATDLQRDHEVTQIRVTLTEKARDWAEIADALDRVAKEVP